MDGLRIIAKPFSGVTLKGLVGKQRYYWEDIWQTENGLVRGADAEVSLNDIVPSFASSNFFSELFDIISSFLVIIGILFLSKISII